MNHHASVHSVSSSLVEGGVLKLRVALIECELVRLMLLVFHEVFVLVLEGLV